MSARESGSVQQQLTAPGSMLCRYKDTVVGNKGWLTLLFYEFNDFFFQSFPGNPGKWIRSKSLPFLLKKIGKSTMVDTNVTMRRPGQISLGSHVTIACGVTINIKDNGEEIRLGDFVQVGEKTVFSCIGDVLDVGRKTVIGKQCRLGSKKGLRIGESCQIGHSTYIVGASHAHQRTDLPIIDQPITCKGPSFIGSHVIIGDNVTILDGIRIGSQARIESGSLVTQDIEDGVHVAGIPARNLTENL